MPEFVHISDLHFPTRLSIFSLKKKMFIGYINYTLRRKKLHPKKGYDALLKFLSEKRWEGIFITGDITNVSGEKEFAVAKETLSPILTNNTMVVPGNHDRYTIHSLEPTDLFDKYFGEFSGKNISNTKGIYLRHKKLGGIDVLAWDSNQPTSITEASGKITDEVLEETRKFIIQNNIHNYILLCHHPLWNPPDKHEFAGHKMQERERIIAFLNQHKPIIYLHGHHHTNWYMTPSEKILFPILNSASSTRVSDSMRDSGFHTFTIEKDQVNVQRFIYDIDSDKIVSARLLKY